MNRTPQDIGRQLATRWRGRPAPEPERGEGDAVPLSSAQEGIWLFEQLHPGTAVNNLTFLGTVDGEVDVPALTAAVRKVCQRHDILRTTFTSGPVVHDDLIVEPRVVDVTDADEEEAVRQAREASREPFDLATGPLLRVVVYRLPGARSLLAVTAHHLIADGWSLGVFLAEVSAADIAGTPPQYADVARRQRDEPVDTTYWRDRLRDQEPLRLPTDQPRPATPRFRSAAVPVHVNAEVTDGVRALAAQTGATPYMVLLAAFQVLLGKLTGQTDVTVGSPTAMRQRASAPRVIGPLINMVALRTDLGGARSFRDVLGRVRQSCLGAYAHQSTPFEAVVGELGARRDLSRSPIFQAMLVHQEELAVPSLGGLPITPVLQEPSATQHDLEMYVWSGRADMMGFLGYDADLFTADTAHHIADRWGSLLSTVVAGPDQDLTEVPVTFPGEPELLTELARGTATPIPDRLLHEWFEAQADQTPDAIAIRATDGELTYRELDQRANQLAHHLRTGPEDLVGVCLPRTSHLIVALLAVLKTGAAYVPIDPAYPKDRITYILNDANANTLITNDNHQGPWRTVPTDQTSTITTRPTTTATSNNLAYVIYTSGSTGLPKGVMIEHRHTAAMITWATTTFTAGELANVLASTSVCFDLSVYEIFAPLAIGGSITLTENNALDLIGSNLSDLTLINTVPSVAQELLTADALPTSAATINLAGEALSPALVRALYDQPHVTAVNNLYGPSEDTTYSTHALTTSTDQRTPIGKPLHNTQAHVLDSDLRPVPYGSIGELYLGGASITRGYHQRPALTAERYLPDPHNPGKRLYRTGDLARWRPDGQLDYHGRTDHQIKHHGHRIEPAEIETTLQEHPHVTQAAVIKRNDTLCAYVVGVELDDDTTSLRNHLRATLPTHMIPTAWVFLDTLPLTPNRKIDRNALPEPTAAPTQHEPPRNDPERLIAAVWQDILEIDRVGVHDNFFALGGHSLLATRITHQLQNQLHTTIPLHLLFQHPTIAELATALPATDIAEITVLPRAEENGRVTLPSSFGQERLWFLTELTPQAHLAYTMTGGATLHGPLNTTALHNAITTTIQRHETLRTTLHQHHQTIHSDAEFALSHIDLTDEPEQDRRLSDLLNQQAELPFDLAEGPLFRALLVRLGDDHHALIVSMHHAISDGWSLDILLREISTHYLGTTAALPPLQIGYADFAAWQRDRFADGSLDPQIAYWTTQLAGAVPLELPTDFPRPPRQTFNGAACPVRIGADLAGRVEDIARAEGVTVFMVLLAAYQVLLARMSGQDDIAVGSPVTGRQHPDVANLIGFFVNTLVLRTDLSGDPTFAELLHRVRRTCLAGYAHQDAPFEKVVEQLQPDRDLSRSPLFQAMLVHQDNPLGTLDIDGVVSSPLWPDQRTSQFDLTLRLEPTADGLGGELVHNTDLFTADTAQRFADRFRTLLSALTSAPDQRIHDVPVMPSGEVELLSDLTPGKQTQVSSRLLHEWFEEQADRTPDAIAVRAADGELTYRELDQRANQLAHHLHTGPEDLVGICLPRTLDLITALLAVLKTGAAYVPIDPAYPKDRITYILNDANANTLVTNDDHDGPWRTVRIDEASATATRLTTTAISNNLAYVIYTSGSTGLPKGVMIEHRHTAAMITWATTTFTKAQLTNVLASTSVCFDLSVYEIFAPLAIGGSITLTENNALDLIVTDPGDITLINTVPSVAQELLTSEALPRTAATINLAGEALSPALVRALYDQPHIKAVNNLYGPSEDTTYSTHALTTSTDQRTPIGKPLHNTQAYVLDDNLHPVPVGSIGELYLGGASITRGYHQRPALTAERYLPDPHRPGQRLYRTGDVVRWRSDGQLDYFGRTDHQIKHHGHRIEPAEIETTLQEHPHVTHAAVVKHNDTLAAYVVAPDLDEDPTSLRAHLGTTLPTHMIPTAWVFLDTLPLTPNRKIDRNALPDPTAAPTQHEPPRNDTERLIAAVWQEVLEKHRVGIHDNFFTLGGHSLLATRIINKIQSQLHIAVPLHLLFQHPTIAELATALPATNIAEIPVQPRAEENGRVTLPSSFGQERLWFLTELTPQAHLAYTMTGGATLHGPLNTTALHNAITTTIQRHETLRTTLHQHHQAVHVDAQPYFAQIDLTSETQVADLLHEQAATPFDLAEGPLFRATLARLGDDRHALVIAMHHAISDGWSLDILLREITSTYTALVDGRAPELPPLPVQYADFAAWQRTQLTDMGPSIAYWRNQLAGTTPLELTPDFPRPARQTFTGATHPVEVDAALGNAVQELAKAEGVTVFMLLLAAFQTLLARISGQHDITVGSPVAGRQHPDVANLIGFFVNTLVLRANLSAGQSFRDVLDRTRSTCLDAYAHQDVPFDKLVEELQPERDLSRSPLFQVMFVLDEAVPRYTMPGVEIEELRPEQRSSQFELTLRLAHTSTGLSGELIYNTDLFTAATAQRVADRFLTLLSALVTDPDQFVHELPVMPSGEAELLAELVRGDDTPISGRLLHEWFEAQADQTPDAIAIRATDGELTYRELDQRANQLAHHLRTGPEDLVGICLPRTLDLIVALLAVLKTGAAYVPIDPAYPKDRITYILNDANANTLITNDNHQGPWRTIPTDQTSTITTRPTTTATNNNLAYVIYTSGSTGLPKGVMIEHHHTTALITWATTTFTKAQLTNVLASTSVCFDLSVYEIFAPLAIGGSITLTENNALDLMNTDPGGLTLINTVPSVAQELLTAQALPTSASTINLAGEPLSPALVHALYDQPHVTAVNNLYGPSEDTTYSTHALTTSTDQRTPIGKPLHNTQAYVLDDNLHPVPVGSIGELYLGGASITRGYHQRPALTAERYLPDPHRPGQRLYRTGDVVRWRSDGQLDYFGRTDHQIKHHGHRIEPAEIETTLQEHPAVTDAAIALKNDILVAYVVAPDVDEDPAPLQSHLRTTLPTHMVPTVWVFLDALPLTPNRKIDRKALPEPTAAPTQYEEPRTDAERLIAGVWQEVLEKDEIGIRDNFFTLGGHSLLATRITNKLQTHLNATIPLHLLFQHPTIAELAEALPDLGHGTTQAATIPRLRRSLRAKERT